MQAPDRLDEAIFHARTEPEVLTAITAFADEIVRMVQSHREDIQATPYPCDERCCMFEDLHDPTTETPEDCLDCPNLPEKFRPSIPGYADCCECSDEADPDNPGDDDTVIY